jgi:hypothetical protein
MVKVDLRRRLTDLYARGEELTITGEEGEEPVTLWIKKLTPVDAETAIARAGAARARVWAMKQDDEPSDILLSFQGQLAELDQEQLVIWASQADMATRRVVIEARVSFEEPWSKDGYLDGLMETANDPEFMKKVEDEPNDPDVVRVNAELQKFYDQVDAEVATELEAVKRSYESWQINDLREHVLDAILKVQADTAWLAEYERSLAWLCTFDNENRSTRVFATRVEINELQDEVFSQIVSACDRINVPDLEGKDSPLTRTS